MNICIDIGNSFIKVCIFRDDEVVYSSVFTEYGAAEITELFLQFPGIKKGIVSSVRVRDEKLIKLLQSRLQKLIILDYQTHVPIKNHYQTPQTLGKDRLAAVIGANYLYPSKNILVIDAGSAITFDFINSKGEYKGGNISPGLTMRFRSLHEFTSKLPLLGPEDNTPFLGQNTKEAITGGVQNSIIFEMDSYIDALKNQYPDLLTLVTGGDAKFFDNKVKNTIFVVSNLVLIGLNRILNFNA
ncbi:MAG: type III pantothenate kinase [Bacteroidales bacterium]|nr:type III pantothenate kinase [Bacteroidales bacterium]